MAKPAKTTSAALDRVVWVGGLDPDRRAEGERLLDIFQRATGWEPRLWGPSMVGFGRYEYRYDSGTMGQSLATGFALRGAEVAVYGLPVDEGLRARLGPHRSGKACLYLRRLERVDEGALADLIRAGLAELAARWPVHPV